MNIAEEIKKRRTFAIISHPDAGKTTLTEKFLLYGGAINLQATRISQRIPTVLSWRPIPLSWSLTVPKVWRLRP